MAYATFYCLMFAGLWLAYRAIWRRPNPGPAPLPPCTYEPIGDREAREAAFVAFMTKRRAAQ